MNASDLDSRRFLRDALNEIAVSDVARRRRSSAPAIRFGALPIRILAPSSTAEVWAGNDESAVAAAAADDRLSAAEWDSCRELACLRRIANAGDSSDAGAVCGESDAGMDQLSAAWP